MLDPERAIFLTEELDAIDYTSEQAKRARIWILFGDWKMRGADPTLELSDFFPDDEQYHSTVQRMTARQAPKVAANTSRSNAEFAEFRKRYLDADGFLS